MGNLMRDKVFYFTTGKERVEDVEKGHWAAAIHLNGLLCSVCLIFTAAMFLIPCQSEHRFPSVNFPPSCSYRLMAILLIIIYF